MQDNRWVQKLYWGSTINWYTRMLWLASQCWHHVSRINHSKSVILFYDVILLYLIYIHLYRFRFFPAAFQFKRSKPHHLNLFYCIFSLFLYSSDLVYFLFKSFYDNFLLMALSAYQRFRMSTDHQLLGEISVISNTEVLLILKHQITNRK